MDLITIRICSGCGKDYEKLETQLDGEDYCNVDCFMEYNSPCENCSDIVPVGEGVYYKEEGYTLCWKCACGEVAPNNTAETTKQEKISLYEKNRRAVYATGNKWAIENWNTTH